MTHMFPGDLHERLSDNSKSLQSLVVSVRNGPETVLCYKCHRLEKVIIREQCEFFSFDTCLVILPNKECISFLG